MKKSRKLLLFFTVMLLSLLFAGTFALSAQAVSYDSNPANYDFYYQDMDGGFYSVRAYNGSGTRIQIPDTYNDGVHGSHPVLTVYNYFATYSTNHLAGVVEVKLGDNIATIDEGAFTGAPDLEMVTMNSTSNLAWINRYAFSGSFDRNAAPSKLRYVGYYDSTSGTYKMPAKLERVFDGAFSRTDSLEYIDFSKSKVIEIYGSCFSGSGVKSVTLNSNTVTVGLAAFENCAQLTQIDIPKSVTYIGAHAFENCSAMDKIFLRCGRPEGSYGWGAFGTDTFKGLKTGCTIYAPKPASKESYDYLIQGVYTYAAANGNVKLRWISSTIGGSTTAQPVPTFDSGNPVTLSGDTSGVTFKDSNGNTVSSFTYNPNALSGIGAIIEINGSGSNLQLTMRPSSSTGLFGDWNVVNAYNYRQGTDASGFGLLRGTELTAALLRQSELGCPETLDITVSLDNSIYYDGNNLGIYYYFPSLIRSGTYQKPQTSVTAAPVVVVYRPADGTLNTLRPELSGGNTVDVWYPNFDNGEIVGVGEIGNLPGGGRVQIRGYESVFPLDTPINDTTVTDVENYNVTYQWYKSTDNSTSTPGDDVALPAYQGYLQFDAYDRVGGTGIDWKFGGIDEAYLKTLDYGAHYFYCKITAQNGSAEALSYGISNIYTLAVAYTGDTASAILNVNLEGFSGTGNGSYGHPYIIPDGCRNLYLDANYMNEDLTGIDTQYEWTLGQMGEYGNYYYPNRVITNSRYCTVEDILKTLHELDDETDHAYNINEFRINIHTTAYCNGERLSRSYNNSIYNPTEIRFQISGVAEADPRGVIHFGNIDSAITSTTRSDVHEDGVASFAINLPADAVRDEYEGPHIAIAEAFDDEARDTFTFELYEVANQNQTRGGTLLVKFDNDRGNLYGPEIDGSRSTLWGNFRNYEINLASKTYQLPDASPRYCYVKVTQTDFSEGKTYVNYSPLFLLIPDVSTCESNTGARPASAAIDSPVSTEFWAASSFTLPIRFTLTNAVLDTENFGFDYYRWSAGRWDEMDPFSVSLSDLNNIQESYENGEYTVSGNCSLFFSEPSYMGAEFSEWFEEREPGTDYIDVRPFICVNGEKIYGSTVRVHLLSYGAAIPEVDSFTTTGGTNVWNMSSSQWENSDTVAASTERYFYSDLKDSRIEGEEYNQPVSDDQDITFTAVTTTDAASIIWYVKERSISDSDWQITYQNGTVTYTDLTNGVSNNTGIKIEDAGDFTTDEGHHVVWTDKYITATYTDSGKSSTLTVPCVKGNGSNTVRVNARAAILDGGSVTSAGSNSKSYSVYINTNQYPYKPWFSYYQSNATDIRLNQNASDNLPEIKWHITNYQNDPKSTVKWQFYKNTSYDTRFGTPIEGASGSFIGEEGDAIWQLSAADTAVQGTWYYYCVATVTDNTCTVVSTETATSDPKMLSVADSYIVVPEAVMHTGFSGSSYSHLIGTDYPETMFSVTVDDPPACPVGDTYANVDQRVSVAFTYGTETDSYLIGGIDYNGDVWDHSTGSGWGSVTDNGNGTHTYTFPAEQVNRLGLNGGSNSPSIELRFVVERNYYGSHENLYASNGTDIITESTPFTVYERKTYAPTVSALTLDAGAKIADVTLPAALGGYDVPAYQQYDYYPYFRPVNVTVTATPDDADTMTYLALEVYNRNTEEWDTQSYYMYYCGENNVSYNNYFYNDAYLGRYYTLSLPGYAVAFPAASGELLPIAAEHIDPETYGDTMIVRLAAYQCVTVQNGDFIDAFSDSCSAPAYSEIFVIDRAGKVDAETPVNPTGWYSSNNFNWDLTNGCDGDTQATVITAGLGAWTVTDGGDVSYQWKIRDVNGDYHDIVGATAPTLTIDAAQMRSYIEQALTGSTSVPEDGGTLELWIYATNSKPTATGDRQRTSTAYVYIHYGTVAALPVMDTPVADVSLVLGADSTFNYMVGSAISNASALPGPKYNWEYEIIEVDGVTVPAAKRYRQLWNRGTFVGYDQLQFQHIYNEYTYVPVFTDGVWGTSSMTPADMFRNNRAKDNIKIAIYSAASNYDSTATLYGHENSEIIYASVPQIITLKAPVPNTTIRMQYLENGVYTECTDLIPIITDARSLVLTAPDDAAQPEGSSNSYIWYKSSNSAVDTDGGFRTCNYVNNGQSYTISASNFDNGQTFYQLQDSMSVGYGSAYALEKTSYSAPIQVLYQPAEAQEPEFYSGSSRNTVVNDPGDAIVDALDMYAPDGGTLEYQWSLDGTPIPGQTTETLSVTAPTVPGRYVYTCLITNNRGAGNTADYTYTRTTYVRGIVLDDVADFGALADGDEVSFTVTGKAYGFNDYLTPGHVPDIAFNWNKGHVSGSDWLNPDKSASVYTIATSYYEQNISVTFSGTAYGSAEYHITAGVNGFAIGSAMPKDYVSNTVNVSFSSAAFVIDRQDLPLATMEQAYSGTLKTTGTGLVPPVEWGITDWDGLTDMSIDPATGEISGIPPLPGRYHLSVYVTDAHSVTAVGTVDLIVQSKAAVGGTVLYVGSDTKSNADTKDYSGTGWSWDHEAKVLTLDNYTGPGFRMYGTPGGYTKADRPFYIKLIGTNTITSDSGGRTHLNTDAGEMFLIGDGTLTIENSGDAGFYASGFGDATNSSYRPNTHLLCGNVTINIDSKAADMIAAIAGNVDMTEPGYGNLTINLSSYGYTYGVMGGLDIAGSRKADISVSYSGTGAYSHTMAGIYDGTLHTADNAAVDIALKAAGPIANAFFANDSIELDSSAVCNMTLDTTATAINSSSSFITYSYGSHFWHTGSGDVNMTAKLGKLYNYGNLNCFAMNNAKLTGTGAINVSVSSTDTTSYYGFKALQLLGTPELGASMGDVTVTTNGGTDAYSLAFSPNPTTIDKGKWTVTINNPADMAVGIDVSTLNLTGTADMTVNINADNTFGNTINGLYHANISDHAKLAVNIDAGEKDYAIYGLNGMLTTNDSASANISIIRNADNDSNNIYGTDRLAANSGSVNITVEARTTDGTALAGNTASVCGVYRGAAVTDANVNITVRGGKPYGIYNYDNALAKASNINYSTALLHNGSGDITIQTETVSTYTAAIGGCLYQTAECTGTLTATVDTAGDGCVAQAVDANGGYAVLTVNRHGTSTGYGINDKVYVAAGGDVTVNNIRANDAAGSGSIIGIYGETTNYGKLTVNVKSMMADGVTPSVNVNAVGMNSAANFNGGTANINVTSGNKVTGAANNLTQNGGTNTITLNGANGSGVGTNYYHNGGTLNINGAFVGNNSSVYGIYNAPYETAESTGTLNINLTTSGTLTDVTGIKNSKYNHVGANTVNITIDNTGLASNYVAAICTAYNLTLADGCGAFTANINGGSNAKTYGVNSLYTNNNATIGNTSITVSGGSAECYAVSDKLSMDHTGGTITLDTAGSTATASKLVKTISANLSKYKVVGDINGDHVEITPILADEIDLIVSMPKDRLDPGAAYYSFLTLTPSCLDPVEFSYEVTAAPAGINKDTVLAATIADSNNYISYSKPGASVIFNTRLTIPGTYTIHVTITSTVNPLMTTYKDITFLVDGCRPYLSTSASVSGEISTASPIVVKKSETTNLYALVASAGLNAYDAVFTVKTDVPGLAAAIVRAPGAEEYSHLTLDASACAIGASGTVTVRITNPGFETDAVYNVKIVANTMTELTVNNTAIPNPSFTSASDPAAGWNWEPDGCVLTLEDYDGAAIMAKGDDLTIIYSGENTVTLGSSTSGTCIDNRNQTLTITAADDAAKLTIGGIYSRGITAKDIILEGGKVTINCRDEVFSNYTSHTIKSVTLKNMIALDLVRSNDNPHTDFFGAFTAFTIDSDKAYYIVDKTSEYHFSTETPADEDFSVSISGSDEVTVGESTVLTAEIESALNDATFYTAVGVETAAPITYQWSKNGTPIGGATEKTYTATAELSVGDSAVYTCAVTVTMDVAQTYTSAGHTLTTVAAGVTVRGQVTSYNPNNATTVELKQGGVTKYSTVIPADSGSGQVTQSFTIDSVPAGTYDLVVTKAGHLTYTVTGVVVGSGDIDLTADARSEISLLTLLCGDVNGDGSISEADVSVIRYSANINKATTAAANPAADVNGDGSVNEADVSVVRYSTHINKSAEVHCTYTF